VGTGRRGFIGLIALAACAPLLSATQASAAQDVVFQCGHDLCLVDPFAPATPTNITLTTPEGGATASENYPSWSPDGSTIAYKGIYSPDTNDIFVTDTVPGGTAINVSQTPTLAEADEPPQWSPGGNRLAYDAKADNTPENHGVYVSSATGTATPIPIGATSGPERFPTWSPDGTKVAFARTGAVNIANADGSGPLQPVSGATGALQLQWSPDGTRIAYLTVGDQIKVVRVDGTGAPITLPGTAEDWPQWSPDSSRLTWVAEGSPLRVVVAPADNPAATLTTIPLPAGSVVPHRPSFSADGSHVVFHATTSSGGGFQQIFVGKADGTAPATQITSTAMNNSAPDWKWTPTGNPPVDPPVDPDRPAATINLNRAYGGGGFYNFHRLNVGIDCNAQGGSGASNPLCQGDGIVKGVVPKRNPRAPLAKAKPKVLAKGSKTIEGGKTGTLKLKLTKAGKKVKPGTKFKVTMEVTVKSDGLETVKAEKSFKVKVPKKKKK
jgi:Tol biopolymer transport system component